MPQISLLLNLYIIPYHMVYFYSPTLKILQLSYEQINQNLQELNLPFLYTKLIIPSILFSTTNKGQIETIKVHVQKVIYVELVYIYNPHLSSYVYDTFFWMHEKERNKVFPLLKPIIRFSFFVLAWYWESQGREALVSHGDF